MLNFGRNDSRVLRLLHRELAAVRQSASMNAHLHLQASAAHITDWILRSVAEIIRDIPKEKLLADFFRSG